MCLCIVVSFVRLSLELQVVNACDKRTQSVVNCLIMASLACVKNISQAGRHKNTTLGISFTGQCRG